MSSHEEAAQKYEHFLHRCDVCSLVLPSHLVRVGVCSLECAEKTGDENIVAQYRAAQSRLIKEQWSTRGPCSVCGKIIPKSREVAPQLRPILRMGYCSRECAEEGGDIARQGRSQSKSAVDARLGRLRKKILAQTEEPVPISDAQQDVISRIRDEQARLRVMEKQYHNSLMAFTLAPRSPLTRRYVEDAKGALEEAIENLQRMVLELEYTPNRGGRSLRTAAWVVGMVGVIAVAIAAVRARSAA